MAWMFWTVEVMCEKPLYCFAKVQCKRENNFPLQGTGKQFVSQALWTHHQWPNWKRWHDAICSSDSPFMQNVNSQLKLTIAAAGRSTNKRQKAAWPSFWWPWNREAPHSGNGLPEWSSVWLTHCRAKRWLFAVWAHHSSVQENSGTLSGNGQNFPFNSQWSSCNVGP